MILYKIQILHCAVGDSDKVYIIEMLEHPHPDIGKYTLVTSWGRRSAPRLSSQVKVEREPQWVAQDEYNRIIKQKLKGGYTRVSFDTNKGEIENLTIPGYRRSFDNSSKSGVHTVRVSSPISAPAEGSLTRGMV